MAKLNVAPTKSSYLELSSQLESAKEGYELLEQKRQILIFELMSRLGRARDAERRMAVSVCAEVPPTPNCTRNAAGTAVTVGRRIPIRCCCDESTW
jgi:V/A-type H+-transporting ATPase subunit D